VRLDPPHPVRPRVEELEARLVPSGTGNAWPHQEVITLSFVPDGTILSAGIGGNITSNLFAKFNAHPGWTTDTWQHEIIRAAQTWAQQTNINFNIVTDSGASAGSGSYQQGDSQFGDIRVGGYDLGATYLAGAYLPPPVNNFSVAGDVSFNTTKTFNINTTYDLFTVAAHEIGHAIGLGHSNLSNAEMFATYNGTKPALTADDISSVQGVYDGARTPDQYDAVAANDSFATATPVTITNLTALQTGLDITTTSDVDYYTFTAPAGTTGTLKVTVQTAGLSLLRQSATLYASNETTVLGSASAGSSYDGTTQTITITGVTAGQRYYLKVDGADNTAFGTGKYALTLNFGSGASPTVPLPNTQTANGSPLQGGGSLNQTAPEGAPESVEGLEIDPGFATRGVPPPSRALLQRLEDQADDHGSDDRAVSVPALSGVPANSPFSPFSEEGGQADSLRPKNESPGPSHRLTQEQINNALFESDRTQTLFCWTDSSEA